MDKKEARVGVTLLLPWQQKMDNAASAPGAEPSGWWTASAQLSNYLTSNLFYPGPSEALGWAGLGWV